MVLIDEVGTKMAGTKLAAFPWRPASPNTDDLADLAIETLARCDRPTEAVIVVTAAEVVAQQRKG